MTIPRAAIPLSASVDHQQKHENSREGRGVTGRTAPLLPMASGRGSPSLHTLLFGRSPQRTRAPSSARADPPGGTDLPAPSGCGLGRGWHLPGPVGGDCALNLQGLAHSPEVRTGRAPRRLRATGRGRGAARPGGNAAPLGRLSQFQLRSTYGCGRTAVLICPLLSVSRPSLSTDDRAAPQMIDFVLI